MKQTRPGWRRHFSILGAIVAGCCLAGAISSAAGAEDVTAFLARHKKALGGDKALENMSSVSFTGKVRRGDTSRDFRWILVSPSLFREEIQDDRGTGETVATDGRNVWVTSVNGASRGVQGCARTMIEFMGVILSRGYLHPGDIGWTWDAPAVLQDGTTRLSAAMPDGTTAVLEFQGKKPRLASARLAAGACTLSLVFQDYARHARTRLAERVTVIRGAGSVPTTYQIESVDPTTEIAPETFDRPGTTKHIAGFDEDTSSIELPMARDRSGRVFVQFPVGGESATWWLIDTRAVHTSIPRSRIDAMKLEAAGTWDWWCPAAGKGTPAYRLPAIQIQGLTLGPVIVAPSEGVPGPDGRPAGTVGVDLLRHLVVSIRWTNQKVVLQDPDRFMDTGAGDALPLDAYDRIVVLVGGRVVLPVGIETAVGTPVVMTGAPVSASGLAPREEQRLPAEIGRPVREDDYLAVLDTLQIGGTTLEQVPARYHEAPAEPACGTEPAPLLGAGLLERFDLTLDLPHRQIIVTPGDQTTAPFRFDRSGLALTRNDDGRWVVGEKAAGTDIRPGDVLLAVKSGKRWLQDLEAIAQALEAPAGAEVVLRVRRGKRTLTRKLTLTNPRLSTAPRATPSAPDRSSARPHDANRRHRDAAD